jgi:hypothetical protein
MGLSVVMSTEQFISDNKNNILNIDGNLDQATITIMTPTRALAFYWFENGVYLKHIVKA